MNRLFIILLTPFCALILISCATTEYVVLRDVPSNPSFQVVPTYLDPNEITYANNIERALIGSGVKVFLRPAHKEVTTEKVLPEDKSRREPYETRKIEYTFEYETLSADYLVQTYFSPKQIKISKVSTQELLSVFTVSNPSQIRTTLAEHQRKIMSEVLVKLGILNQLN